MELTLREIRYIRLAKQGLITPFDSLEELFDRLEIQAQNESDAFFNVDRRLAQPVSPQDIQEAAIRLWYVRNTIFLMGRRHYDKAVFVNRLTDNWFHKKRITTPADEADVQKIIGLCLDKGTVAVDDLVALGCNRDFIRVWSGAFIELARRGVLKSKYKGLLEINHEPVREDHTVEDVMRQYFDVFGPAAWKDFLHWSGFTAAQSREAFERIRSEYLTVNGDLLMAPRDADLLPAGELPLIILGKFDSVCLSYRDKSWLVPNSDDLPRVWGKAGIVEAVILRDGQAAATWRRDKAGVHVFPIQKLPKTLRKKITAKFREIFDPSVDVEFC